jgi:DNA helicase-2/ATP-dependent DNA helicase PcrA
LEALATERQLHGLEMLPVMLESDLVNKGVRAKLAAFYALLHTLQDEARHMSVASITHEVLTRTGYVAQLEAEQTAEAQARLENLGELVNAADEFDRHGDGEGLQAFLEQTALLSDQDNLDGSHGAVVLMTLHTSKGLEFPVVFIAGMENGLFPHSRSFDEQAQMEEERRLCYVGMTRAKTRLFLTGAARRRLYGVEQNHTPSLFLGDIPRTCVHDYSPQPILATALHPWEAQGPVPPLPKAPLTSRQRGNQSLSTPYAVGTQVLHQHFGRGVIQRREGEGDQLKLTVLFRDYGVKKLLARHAPLQPL